MRRYNLILDLLQKTNEAKIHLSPYLFFLSAICTLYGYIVMQIMYSCPIV